MYLVPKKWQFYYIWIVGRLINFAQSYSHAMQTQANKQYIHIDGYKWQTEQKVLVITFMTNTLVWHFIYSPNIVSFITKCLTWLSFATIQIIWRDWMHEMYSNVVNIVSTFMNSQFKTIHFNYSYMKILCIPITSVSIINSNK